jgi:hypothetical protein
MLHTLVDASCPFDRQLVVAPTLLPPFLQRDRLAGVRENHRSLALVRRLLLPPWPPMARSQDALLMRAYFPSESAAVAS